MFRYVERNPINTKSTKSIGEYKWASSTLILDNKYKKLFKNSLLLKDTVYSILDEELGESDYLSLDEFQKIVYQKREDEIISSLELI